MTDKLVSYVVAHRELMPSFEHRRTKYLNNRAENSHQPIRERERVLKFFLHPVRHTGSWRCSARSRRTSGPADTRSPRAITDRFATWNDVTGVPVDA